MNNKIKKSIGLSLFVFISANSFAHVLGSCKSLKVQHGYKEFNCCKNINAQEVQDRWIPYTENISSSKKRYDSCAAQNSDKKSQYVASDSCSGETSILASFYSSDHSTDKLNLHQTFKHKDVEQTLNDYCTYHGKEVIYDNDVYDNINVVTLSCPTPEQIKFDVIWARRDGDETSSTLKEVMGNDLKWRLLPDSYLPGVIDNKDIMSAKSISVDMGRYMRRDPQYIPPADNIYNTFYTVSCEYRYSLKNPPKNDKNSYSFILRTWVDRDTYKGSGVKQFDKGSYNCSNDYCAVDSIN
ncbi:MAG TPA: hypothetical protein VKR58_07235 [Aquella sp.]|nr:hypothetical protein [Aquella sp.]